VPNLEKFNIKNELVLKMDLDGALILNAVIYGICYTGALLVLSILIFNKKEFK
jgi:hypothetical protein